MTRWRYFDVAKMKELQEQRFCVKFCFSLRKTATETWQMLHQYLGSERISPSQCFEWYRRFQKGWSSTDEDQRNGRPTTSTVTYWCSSWFDSPRSPVDRVAATFVPRVLAEDQKAINCQVWTSVFMTMNNTPTLPSGCGSNGLFSLSKVEAYLESLCFRHI